MKSVYSILFFLMFSVSVMAQDTTKSMIGRWLWTETKQQIEGMPDEMREALDAELERSYYKEPTGLMLKDDGVGYFLERVEAEEDEMVKLFYKVEGNNLSFSQVPNPSEEDNTYSVNFFIDGQNLVLVMDFTERVAQKLEHESITKVQLLYYFAKEE